MSSNLFLLAFLYFIQGLPYGLQSRFLPTYFRSNGMSLTNLGLFKLLLAPWMLKTLWAPLVDKYGSKKSWLVTSMVGLVITCLLGAFSEPDNIIQLASILLLFNLLTSTQDIAVDGAAINLLTTVELGYGNIAQVVGYKFGAIFGGGLLTWLMEYISWISLFQSLAMVYCLGVFIVFTFLPKTSEQDNSHHKHDVVTKQMFWWKSHISDVFNTEGTYWILMYVLIYKLGEQGALSMTPLFLLDNGVSTATVGFWIGIVGQISSIAGSIIGGYVSSYFRCSIISSLKLTNTVRIALLLTHCIIIWFWSSIEVWFGHHINFVLVVIIASFMLIISGSITTLTFTLMMECSKRAPSNVQATHYTTLATCEVIGKLCFSVVTGALTDYLGYNFIYFVFLMLAVCVIPILWTHRSYTITSQTIHND